MPAVARMLVCILLGNQNVKNEKQIQPSPSFGDLLSRKQLGESEARL